MQNYSIIASASGDYHGQMNHENFEKWLKEMFLPNIPSNSIIVMDNSPYHSVLAKKKSNEIFCKERHYSISSREGCKLRRGHEENAAHSTT